MEPGTEKGNGALKGGTFVRATLGLKSPSHPHPRPHLAHLAHSANLRSPQRISGSASAAWFRRTP